MRPVAAANSNGGGGGEDGGGNWYNSLNFFSHRCGLRFCLAYVELYGRNSTTGNITIFPLSRGISAGGGISQAKGKGFFIWHRFDSILDYCFRVYFGTVTYVDYLTFSHLNPITNPTPRLNATLPIEATARNPNYWGSRVYPNYRGSCTQPILSGLPHATLTIGAATCNHNGRGSRARPGQGRRCARASPLRLALHARGLGFTLAVCATCSQQLNEFMYYN
jgi:hypothetical protein